MSNEFANTKNCIDPKDYLTIPIHVAIDVPSKGVFHIYKDKYWAVMEGSILFYKNFDHPQCNPNERLVERIPAVTKHGGKVMFLQRVFVPHECEGYL